MKPKYRAMLQQSLTERAQAFEAAREIHPPSHGWLQAVRTALGMPLRFPAARLHISPVAIKTLENREATGAITLKSMAKVADALGCDFVYAVLPRGGSFQQLLKQQAHAKAANLVESVGHSMALEQQGTGKMKQRIAEVAAELSDDPRRLWAES
jgi:predicted DNA-binding mobile mystery protein A